jgi:hypothetical protein
MAAPARIQRHGGNGGRLCGSFVHGSLSWLASTTVWIPPRM